ncbi:MAG: anaerobic glycerol-3-phosphate dehydrogenase subunit C [Candidatus Rokuibacteriota bacterium]|nr:MAG: anaerobic glycerol-3-phosphate dehydrogenase subunit C [Candidatus Rokubacteria bacterium]
MGTLDTKSPEFWDLAAVDKELRRVYDICGGCRRCLPLCPSFKVLFDRMDVEAVDGDVDKLPAGDVKEVVDLCYQCKLCFNHCPYTPPHRWEVDFPRLMLRARAAQARSSGVSVQDRMLGNADLVGKLGSLAAPLSNWMNELSVHRAFMQAVVGIHKQRNLPTFARPTFSSWFKGRAPSRSALKAPAGGAASTGRKVALFATCSVEYYQTSTGRAAVNVLERNRVDVSLPPQRCCGMPYLDGGAVDEAKALIRDNVASLAAAAREGREIVVLGPTCSYMLKQEFPWLDDSADAKLVAANTRDIFEYLAKLNAAGELDTNFTKPVGAVTYHMPCHLRAQNIGHKSADVLRAIPGASVDVVEKCSAVDGTWGFKKEYYELSMRLAKPLFDAVTAGGPVTATDCPLAALQIEQGTGRKPKHPVEVLAAAYGFEA